MTEMITKRRVEMSDPRPFKNNDGNWQVVDGSAIDYVKPEELDAYVEKALESWGSVVVSEEADAGPGGYHGQTMQLDGTILKATKRGGSDFTFIKSDKKIGPFGQFIGIGLGILTLSLTLSAMAIQTSTQRNTLAAAYATAATHGALYSTAPGASAGTELSGGSPAYARKALSWTGTNPKTVTVTFDVASGSTVAGAGVHDAISAGNYLDGTSVTSQAFSSQGTYTLTLSYTQS